MVQIPQIQRDRLASSVVGTPGVDTAGQQIGEAGAQFGNEVASAGFGIAIQQQQQRDAIDTNQLLAQYQLKTINDFEQHKIDFAANPENSSPAFAKQLDQNLSDVVKQAPNDRVGLMIGKGDPTFNARMMFYQGQWASQQEEKNVTSQGVATTTALGEKAADIGADISTSVEQKIQAMKPLADTLGKVVASIGASKRPDLAPEFELKGVKSMYAGLLGRTVDTQPQQTLDLIKNHSNDFLKVFSQKEIDNYSKGALESLTGMKNTANWRETVSSLVNQPDLVQDVRSGKMGWSAIDNMQKNDPQGERNPLYPLLKSMATKQAPEQTNEDVAGVRSAFLDEVHSINLGVSKKTPDGTIQSLLKVNEDLLSARNRGVITQQEFNTYHDKLSSPLISKVLATHDPGWLAQLSQKQNSIWHNLAQAGGDMMDKYNSGYNAIDNYLTANKLDKASGYANTKANLLNDFFKASDKLMAPGAQRPTGGNYTAEDVAHSVLGMEVGKPYNFPGFGLRTISRFVKPGVPTFESTKEDDERIANQKALEALQKRK